MDIKSRVLYVTFPSTYWALRSEKQMLADGLKARLCPVPRRLSSSCGLSLEVRDADAGTLSSYLSRAGLQYEGIYE